MQTLRRQNQSHWLGGCVKTITMDFETYEKEIDKAKAEGAKLTATFVQSLDEAIKTLGGFSYGISRDDLEMAVRKIIRVRDGLK